MVKKLVKIMGKSKGSGDTLYPKCSGPECWCYDCSLDSTETELNSEEYKKYVNSEEITENHEKKAHEYGKEVRNRYNKIAKLCKIHF
jgi:hypothetical protein